MQQQIKDEPVWVRPRRGAQMAGIGLTKFYEWLNAKKIESVKIDGIRLVRVASIKSIGEDAA